MWEMRACNLFGSVCNMGETNFQPFSVQDAIMIIFLCIALIFARISLAQESCESWSPLYYQYCTQSPRPQEYDSSCKLYEQNCLTSGIQSASNSQISQPSNSGKPQLWTTLTQHAVNEQTQQAFKNAQNGQADCGQYNAHYNVWCGGVKPIHPIYCNMMKGVCTAQAQQWATGQSGVNGNAFNSPNGMPTGGAGSTRPLTVGRNFGVGPFFGIGKGFGFNPLQGFGSNQHFDIPILGLNVGGWKTVDWGGLIGVTQLGQLLQGRKRR